MSYPARLGDLLDGRYRVDAAIGAGGMASVVRAHDLQLDRDVALKIFPPGLVDDARRRDGEAKALAALAHPGLVTLFDARLDADPAFLVMELIDGPDLRRRLDGGPLAPSEVVALLRAVASALAAVHAAGLVHRDVKPANILIPTDSGAAGARLADFGIARLVDATRLTATGTLIGTAAYIAPEQLRGEAGAAPADVYALGLVALEALTGRPVYPGGTADAALARLAAPPTPPPLPPTWADLLDRMTRLAPGDRPSATDVLGAIPQLAAESARVAIDSREQADTTALPPTRVLGSPSASQAATVRAPEPQSLADRPRHRTRLVLAAAAGLVVVIAASLALGAALRPAPVSSAPSRTATSDAAPANARDPQTTATPSSVATPSSPQLPPRYAGAIAALDSAIAGDPALVPLRDQLVAALVAGDEDAARTAAAQLARAAHESGRGKEGSDRRKAVEQALRQLERSGTSDPGDDSGGPGPGGDPGPGGGPGDD